MKFKFVDMLCLTFLTFLFCGVDVFTAQLLEAFGPDCCVTITNEGTRHLADRLEVFFGLSAVGAVAFCFVAWIAWMFSKIEASLE